MVYDGWSAVPMTYQMQAIQWANSANVIIKRVRITALYWEYLERKNNMLKGSHFLLIIIDMITN